METEELKILRKVAEAASDLLFAEDNSEFASFCGQDEASLRGELRDKTKAYHLWVDENCEDPCN